MLVALSKALDDADEIFENTLRLKSNGNVEYETEKHESFQTLNAVIIAVKNLLDQEYPDLNTRPLYRLIEEFRNIHAGATNVLIGHKDPALKKGGRPRIADANELMALLVAMMECCEEQGEKPKEFLPRIARDTGKSTKELRDIRSRFSRGDGSSEEMRSLADRLSAWARTEAATLALEATPNEHRPYRAMLEIYNKYKLHGK